MTTEVRERRMQSLHNAVWIALGMERQDYCVQRPWAATVTKPGQSAMPLEAGTRIMQVFEQPEIARQLLILGEPGAGKTTLMLDLAQDLLQRATADNTEPIPVLLSLSSWNDPKQPMFDWLLQELKSKYGLSQALARNWLGKNHLLPLLDGLDEVAPHKQQACAQVLNSWLTGELSQRPGGVLICCRREEFERVVRQPLSLYGAIYLQALTPAQIQQYFIDLELEDVWQTVQQDGALQELLTKPLFLSMFGLVQTQGTFSLADWQTRTSSSHKIEYLLDTYWEAAMERELITNPQEKQRGLLSRTYGTRKPPSRQAIRRSLIFAAKMLARGYHTELLIEKMQPTDLIHQPQKWAYRLIIGLIVGLVFVPISALIFVPIVELIDAPIFGLTAGLIFALILGLIGGLTGDFDKIVSIEAFSVSLSSVNRQKVLRSLREQLTFWLFMIGLLCMLPLWIGFWLFIGIIGFNSGVKPVDGLIFGYIFCLIFGLFVGLIHGLISGLKVDIQTQIKANQGMKNAFKNMVIVSTIAVLTSLPLKWLTAELFAHTMDNPQNFPCIVAASLVCLIWFSLQEGAGWALLQHIALRLVLAANRYAPLRYDLLLNYCTERLLLQRIGGRYRFMHKLLQDHFAQMDLD